MSFCSGFPHPLPHIRCWNYSGRNDQDHWSRSVYRRKLMAPLSFLLFSYSERREELIPTQPGSLIGCHCRYHADTSLWRHSRVIIYPSLIWCLHHVHSFKHCSQKVNTVRRTSRVTCRNGKFWYAHASSSANITISPENFGNIKIIMIACFYIHLPTISPYHHHNHGNITISPILMLDITISPHFSAYIMYHQEVRYHHIT